MNDFTIRRVTDPKEGPIDGVSAETVGVYTKFRGKGLFQAEKRIIKQETTDVGIKAAVSTAEEPEIYKIPLNIFLGEEVPWAEMIDGKLCFYVEDNIENLTIDQIRSQVKSTSL